MILDLISKPKRRQTVKYPHFKTRWHERMGYNISNESCEKLMDKILKDGKFLYCGNVVGTAIYGVDWDGVQIRVVVSLLPMNLITILSPS